MLFTTLTSLYRYCLILICCQRPLRSHILCMQFAGFFLLKEGTCHFQQAKLQYQKHKINTEDPKQIIAQPKRSSTRMRTANSTASFLSSTRMSASSIASTLLYFHFPLGSLCTTQKDRWRLFFFVFYLSTKCVCACVREREQERAISMLMLK